MAKAEEEYLLKIGIGWIRYKESKYNERDLIYRWKNIPDSGLSLVGYNEAMTSIERPLEELLFGNSFRI